jgi:hypothetical protein
LNGDEITVHGELPLTPQQAYGIGPTQLGPANAEQTQKESWTEGFRVSPFLPWEFWVTQLSAVIAGD